MTEPQLIVIADDNKDLAELISLRFAAEPWRSICVGSGQEAFAAVAQGEPSLVLLDIEMPGGGGLDTLKRLKSYPKTAQAPVVMLTGRRAAADVQTAARLGAAGYIVKPFDMEELVRRVRKHLTPTPQSDALML